MIILELIVFSVGLSLVGLAVMLGLFTVVFGWLGRSTPPQPGRRKHDLSQHMSGGRWSVTEERFSATGPIASRLHQRWDLAHIRHYVRQHDDCTTPALQEELLTRGYDPQLVDRVLAERAQAPSKLVPFLLGFGIILVVNLLVYVYYRDNWLVTLIPEGMFLGGFLASGDSRSLRGRPAERGVGSSLGVGFAAGALVSLVFVLFP